MKRKSWLSVFVTVLFLMTSFLNGCASECGSCVYWTDDEYKDLNKMVKSQEYPALKQHINRQVQACGD